MKKYQNIIIAAVVVILGAAVCIMALNGGQSPQGGEQGMPMTDGQGAQIVDGQGMPMEMLNEKNPLAGTEIKFSAKDVDGNAIGNSVFKDNKLTLINLWGTFCSPCIEEMPDLQKIQDEYKGKVKVIGIVDEMETADQVKEVLKQKNITYTNIIANSELGEQLVRKFDYVPVTLLVDSEGKVLETFLPGGGDYQIFKSIIDEQLNK